MAFPLDVQMSIINQIAGQMFEGNSSRPEGRSDESEFLLRNASLRSAMRYTLELPCRNTGNRSQSPKKVYKAMKSLDRRARLYNGDYSLAIQDFLIANPLNLREIS